MTRRARGLSNQIGKFFKSQDIDTASAKIAEHIVKFWDPRMRRAIVAHLDAGGAGLDPATRLAVEMLRPILVFLRSSGSLALASFDDPAPSCAIQPCSGIRFNGHSEPALFGCQLPTICP